MLVKFIGAALLIATMFGCSSANNHRSVSVYEQIGGADKVEEIVDNFIAEIEYSPEIFPYFEKTDVRRFREKLIEHVCMLTSGPCDYTGDSMEQVHAGMNITEHDFNLGVDLFINAMEKAGIEHRLQNKVIATMAPTRSEIIYQ